MVGDLDKIKQIFGKVLKYQKNLVLLLKRLLNIDDILALQHLEHADLLLDVLPGYFVVVALLELLDGHCIWMKEYLLGWCPC